MGNSGGQPKGLEQTENRKKSDRAGACYTEVQIGQETEDKANQMSAKRPTGLRHLLSSTYVAQASYFKKSPSPSFPSLTRLRVRKESQGGLMMGRTQLTGA